MLRMIVPIAAMLLATGCGKVAELASQTRTVAAPREEVFAKMFGDDSAFTGLPLVTNGGSTRLYEMVSERATPNLQRSRQRNAPRPIRSRSRSRWKSRARRT